jgi:hypothetical protein
MPRRRRVGAKRSKLWRVVAVVGIIVLAVGWVVWYLRTPDGLPTSTQSSEGTSVVDQEVYVGMFAVGDDFDRTLHISDISVDVQPDDGVEVTALICRGGSLSVTSDVDSFCPELDEPDGAEFSDGDSIVLAVTAAAPAEVEIGRIEISFRDGIRWGTKGAGLDGATLIFADHTPGTVPDDGDSDDSTTERPEQDDKKDRDKNGNKDKDDKKDKKKDRKGPNA